MEKKSQVALVKAESFKLVPASYVERCNDLVDRLEDGVGLSEAIEEAGLTIPQLNMCRRRDKSFNDKVIELTVGMRESNNAVVSEIVKQKALDLCLKGELVELRVDADGNSTEKRKFPERLMLAMIGAGDSAFRQNGGAEAAGGGAGLVVNLQVTGVDLKMIAARAEAGKTTDAVSVDVSQSGKVNVEAITEHGGMSKTVDVEPVEKESV